MIKQSSVFIALPIAESLVGVNKTFADKSHPLIKGLSDCSYGLVPYTLDNLPLTLPEVTHEEMEHGLLLDEASTTLAESVRKSFQQISHYLKPFAKNLIEEIYKATDIDEDATRQIFDRLQIEYRKLDYGFFDSPFYPKEIDSTIDYSKIPLKDLMLPDNTVDKDFTGFAEYIQAPNAEIKEIFEAYQPGWAFDKFIGNNNWADVFNIFNGYVDLTTAGYKDPAPLFSLYVLFTKMKADENPAPFVKNIELHQYRGYVNRMHNFLTVALVFCSRYYQGLKLTPMPVLSLVGKMEMDRGINLLRGKIVVGLTKKGLDLYAAAAPEGSVSEALAGKAVAMIATKSDKAGLNIVAGAEYFQEVFRNYLAGVTGSLNAKITESCRDAVENALIKFQNEHAELKDTVMGLNDKIEFRRLSHALQSDVDVFVGGYKSQVVANGVPLSKYVMGSDLVASLGNLMGMTFAADVLRTSSRLIGSGEITDVQKREALTEAVVKSLVKHLV